MIDSSAPVADPPVTGPAAPVETAQEQPQAQVVVAPVVEEDDPLEPELAAQVIDIPDGDKLVPLSALRGARKDAKAAKQAAAEAPLLKQQLEAAQQQAAALAPLAEAFRAMQQAQQQPAPQPQAAPVEDTSALENSAKVFDFYKADGTPDLDKARLVREMIKQEATEIAQQQTAPLVQHTLEGQAQHNLERALATTHPVTKQQADPEILGALIGQIKQQPNGLATLANPEAMKQIWLNAYALSTFKAPAPAVPAKADPAPAPPVFVERAGGREDVPKALNAMEKRAAKDAGMTEAEYLSAAKGMPW